MDRGGSSRVCYLSSRGKSPGQSKQKDRDTVIKVVRDSLEHITG